MSVSLKGTNDFLYKDRGTYWKRPKNTYICQWFQRFK